MKKLTREIEQYIFKLYLNRFIGWIITFLIIFATITLVFLLIKLI